MAVLFHARADEAINTFVIFSRCAQGQRERNIHSYTTFVSALPISSEYKNVCNCYDRERNKIEIKGFMRIFKYTFAMEIETNVVIKKFTAFVHC